MDSFFVYTEWERSGSVNNLEKMNELAGAATKQQVVDWAYNNRVMVSAMAYDEPFESMEHSVDVFIQTDAYQNEDDEIKAWGLFLDAPYQEQGE